MSNPDADVHMMCLMKQRLHVHLNDKNIKITLMVIQICFFIDSKQI